VLELLRRDRSIRPLHGGIFSPARTAMVAGLMLTPERRLMANRWFIFGGLVALAIFIPNLVWQIQHHFPHLEMLANIKRSGRNVAIGPIGFIGWQLLGMQPLSAPIWL
jgi:hypothetical protein